MRTFLLIVFSLVVLQVQAQERCSSAAYQDKIRKQHPELASELNRIHVFTRSQQEQLSSSGAMLRTLNFWDTIFIPVVVHVVYNDDEGNISDAQIKSQIDALNADFNKTNPDFSKVPEAFKGVAGEARIHFALATADPDGRATTGIVRKKSGRMFWTDDDLIKYDGHGGSTAWDSKSYLNIWIGNLTSGLLGYASFPGGVAEKDGVVISPRVFGTIGKLHKPFDKGRTATHEIGHWMNLKHLWGDVTCGDDEVFDTPKQRSHNTGCPAFPRVNAGCNNGINGDMFMNFMDFTNDACMGLFTIGQAFMMRSMFAEDMPRNVMLDSKGLNQPWNTSPTPPPTNGFSGNIKLYPNPTVNGTITIVAPEGSNWVGKSYMIFNQSGQMLMTGKLTQLTQNLVIGNLPSGVYYIRAGSSNGQLSTRFVKQ